MFYKKNYERTLYVQFLKIFIQWADRFIEMMLCIINLVENCTDKNNNLYGGIFHEIFRKQ